MVELVGLQEFVSLEQHMQQISADSSSAELAALRAIAVSLNQCDACYVRV